MARMLGMGGSSVIIPAAQAPILQTGKLRPRVIKGCALGCVLDTMTLAQVFCLPGHSTPQSNIQPGCGGGVGSRFPSYPLHLLGNLLLNL